MLRPSISGVTKICPSQSTPAPMPIVGIDIEAVTSLASFAGIFSSTTAKAPASSITFASFKISCASSLVVPRSL